jgi:hypothetical protein
MVAVLSDGTTDLSSSVAQLSVAVAPAPDLTLDTFLAAIEEELERFPGVINVGTRIDDTLRPNLRPAAILSYVLTTRPVEQEPVAGYQVAFFDQNATKLIILTFTTNQDRINDYLPDFKQIVRSVALS